MKLQSKFIDTKVYTTDREVMSLYAELCGKSIDQIRDSVNRSNRVGISLWSGGACFGLFEKGCSIDINKSFKELTEQEVRAFHQEAFHNANSTNNK